MLTTTADYRLDWILHEGDTIQTADATYTITGEPIGLGGSSVLYPASKSGSFLDFCIKECFPASPAVYHRINGIVHTSDPDDELNQAQIEKYREVLFNERKLGQKIRNTTTRAVSVWDELIPVSITTGGETFREVSGGIFSVLERMDRKGRFFNELLADIRNTCPLEDRRTTFGLPSIQLTVQIMEQALLALKQVHDAGYYFGDLSGSNLLLTECDLEKNHVGIGHLIDFGSTRKVESDGFTTPIIDEPVFSTDGFRPFEIRDHKDGALRLSKQADVYSAGCLFLRCVLSPAKIRTLGDSPSVGGNALNEVNGKAIGCTGRALQLVNVILDKATKHDPTDRYVDASEMLDAVLELKIFIEPPRFLLSANLSTPECFDLVLESRKDDMRHINTALAQKNPVFIWGFPGLGKTELSVAYARAYNPDKAYLVRYKKSMRDTIISLQFTDMDDPDLRNLSKVERAIAEEKIYKKKLGELKKYPSDSLLIIDNFDSKTKTFQEMIQEPAYSDLLGINMHILITTRSQPDDVTPEIQPLKEVYLLKLMKRFIGSKKVSDDLLSQLLDACGYHTLSVELIGKAIGNRLRPVSPEYILRKLQNNQLKQAILPKSRTSKDRVFDEDTIYGHLKTLFDIACLSNKEKTILCHAALLPVGGIDTSLFLRAEHSEENHQAVAQLTSRGWLHVSQEQIISLHPLICDLVSEELAVTDQNCSRFLCNMWDKAVNDIEFRLAVICVDDYRYWAEPSEDYLAHQTQIVEKYGFDEFRVFRDELAEKHGYREYSTVEEEYADCKRLAHMIGNVFSNASSFCVSYAAYAAFCFQIAVDQERCLHYSHIVLDELLQKKSKYPPSSDRNFNLDFDYFTRKETFSICKIRDIWCPQLLDSQWTEDCPQLGDNEMLMDHSEKPIQVQSIYAKLRYLLVRD